MLDLDLLAHDIAAFGIDRYESELQTVADFAARRGIAPTLVSILGDPATPAPARERALARLTAAIRYQPHPGLVA